MGNKVEQLEANLNGINQALYADASTQGLLEAAQYLTRDQDGVAGFDAITGAQKLTDTGATSTELTRLQARAQQLQPKLAEQAQALRSLRQEIQQGPPTLWGKRADVLKKCEEQLALVSRYTVSDGPLSLSQFIEETRKAGAPAPTISPPSPALTNIHFGNITETVPKDRKSVEYTPSDTGGKGKDKHNIEVTVSFVLAGVPDGVTDLKATVTFNGKTYERPLNGAGNYTMTVPAGAGKAHVAITGSNNFKVEGDTVEELKKKKGGGSGEPTFN